MSHYREIADAEWAERMARLGGGNTWAHPPKPRRQLPWIPALLFLLGAMTTFGVTWAIDPVPHLSDAILEANQ